MFRELKKNLDIFIEIPILADQFKDLNLYQQWIEAHYEKNHT